MEENKLYDTILTNLANIRDGGLAEWAKENIAEYLPASMFYREQCVIYAIIVYLIKENEDTDMFKLCDIIQELRGETK